MKTPNQSLLWALSYLENDKSKPIVSYWFISENAKMQNLLPAFCSFLKMENAFPPPPHNLRPLTHRGKKTSLALGLFLKAQKQKIFSTLIPEKRPKQNYCQLLVHSLNTKAEPAVDCTLVLVNMKRSMLSAFYSYLK